MSAQKLRIRIRPRGIGVTVKSFADLVGAVAEALREINKQAVPPRGPMLEWQIIDADMHSPLTVVLAGQREGRGPDVDVAAAFVDGLAIIEGSAQRPRFFSDIAMMKAKAIAAVSTNGVAEVVFESGESRTAVTPHTAANVDEVLGRAPSEYRAETVLEGRLEALSVHGDPPDFCIYDPLANHEIRCVFSEEDVARAAELIKRHARVQVTGTAKYNPSHVPVSIEVQEFHVLREQCELPQVRDLHAANIDITHGEDTVEYVRRLRDGS